MAADKTVAAENGGGMGGWHRLSPQYPQYMG
jgi:hypothetical protein